MYTVFILPHRTLDSYHQFEVLMNTEDKSRLFGICPWKMEATTVETALPDLYRLVRDKETWRAIVILADPEDMGGFETDEQNPYDFLMNRNVRHYELDGDGKIIESRIPLIRLTHMICGMPAPEPEFRAQLQNEDETKGHVPKIIYKINREEEENQRRAVSAWNTEHAFQAAPPQQVMLLTARVHSARTDEFDSVHTVWKVHTEADASEFWKRNLYPQNCRFMTFELDRHGEVRLERDYFRMWTAAFLLASNDFDPDILQAHRLYNLDIRLKNRELTERMQETVDRLNLAKYELEQSIEEEEAERRNDFSVKTPDYRVRVSVLLTPDAESERMLTGSPITPEDRFEPAATVETDGEDLSSWRRFTEKVKGNVRRQYEDCARQLSIAAERVRTRVKTGMPQRHPLNRFQEAEMKKQLGEDYTEMSESRAGIPTRQPDLDAGLKDADKKVRGLLKTRMKHESALLLTVIPAVILALAFIPGAFYAEKWWILALIYAGFAAVCVAIVFGEVRSHRKQLGEAVSEYEAGVRALSLAESGAVPLYEKFYSSIASQIRGASYLDAVTIGRQNHDDVWFFKQKHLKKIELLLEQIRTWCTALHIRVDFNSAGTIAEAGQGENVMIDYDSLYTLSVLETYPVEINQSGIFLKAPFAFVDRVILEREGIYDDDKPREGSDSIS
jgi:hypothetical protein